MKIVCAFDSFKGCLSSRRAGEAVREGILSVIPYAEIKIVECADGGEGTAAAIAAAGWGSTVEVDTVNPAGTPIKAELVFEPHSKTACLDMAAASGLALVNEIPEAERGRLAPPEGVSTAGTGIMVAEAVRMGATTVVLGFGGSGTNDAGLGALQALGADFIDKNGAPLPRPICGRDMIKVGHIDPSRLRETLRGVTLRLLCDVNNPFTGPEGAVAVYSRQKGADAAMRSRLEAGMVHLAEVLKNNGFIDISATPGAGAGGGAAGGFAAVAGGELTNGAETVLDMIGLDRAIADADLVLTGEGSSDSQTLCGKLPVAVLRRSLAYGRKCVLMSGCIENGDRLREAGFSEVICINSPMNAAFSPNDNPLDPSVAARRLADAAAHLVSEGCG